MLSALDTEEKRKREYQRIKVGAAASVVAVAIVFLSAAGGYMPYSVAFAYAATVAVLAAVFLAVLLTPLRLKFRDPALALPQFIAAGLATAYPLFEAHGARPSILGVYVMAFTLGMFTLDTRRLVYLALLYFGLCATVVEASEWLAGSATEARREAFRLGGFALLLVWFTVLGSHISSLRSALKGANATLRQLLSDAEALARVDPLTGCYNRRYTMEQLRFEAARAARGNALSVAMLDIDYFKDINDRYGHAQGDEVLKAVVRIVQGVLRVTDFVARYGGEEFLLVFVGASGTQAVAMAERIRSAIASSSFGPLSEERRVTVSIGVAQHAGSDPIEESVNRADRALLEAKRRGRDRVVPDSSIA